MLSFHNDIKIKEKYVARTDRHLKMDNLIQGDGWDGTKGCHVGCTLDKYDHKSYESELGLPEWLARLCDTLHEGQTIEDAKIFFRDFLRSIPVGVDVSKVKHQFCSYLMDCNLEILKDSTYTKVDEIRKIILQVKALHDDAVKTGNFDWSAARIAASAAWSAESSARNAVSADWSAARIAARIAAMFAAWIAARNAAWIAASAARNAASAARIAASAARNAASAAYKKHADKLISLMRELKG